MEVGKLTAILKRLVIITTIRLTWRIEFTELIIEYNRFYPFCKLCNTIMIHQFNEWFNILHFTGIQ